MSERTGSAEKFKPAKEEPLKEESISPKRVGLFVTCLVDLFRPTVGFAAVKLLEEAGCTVEVPMAQTCCGQPAYNSGDREDAAAIARQTIEAFEEFDYVVAPSGSCAGMLKKHYPSLLKGTSYEARAEAFSGRVHELVSFLVDVLGITEVPARHEGSVTYHDSCSGLRELGIQKQPRKLLSSVEGLELKEMQNSDVCCGFGGTFAVKNSDTSVAMGADKARHVRSTGAEVLVAGDSSCLMHVGGVLSRQRSGVRTVHLAEVLAATEGD